MNEKPPNPPPPAPKSYSPPVDRVCRGCGAKVVGPCDICARESAHDRSY